MRMPWEKKEGEGTESTPEGEGGEPKGDPLEKKTEVSVSDPPPTGTVEGVQSPFSADGGLADRTEKDVIDELALLHATNQAQKEALESGRNQPAPVVVPVEPEPEPAAISPEDFFADPAKVIGEVVSQRVQSEMKEIIAPFQADLRQNQAQSAWDTLGNSRANMPLMRPLMEVILKERGIVDPGAGVLEDVYDLALARAVRTGENIQVSDPPPAPSPSPTPTPERQVPPQHHPSSHPIVETTKTEEFEPLSENEARIARERKMTHLQYRQWQAMDEADVLTPVETAS